MYKVEAALTPALRDLSPTQGKSVHTEPWDCLKQLVASHLQSVQTVQDPQAREMILPQLRWIF